LPLLTGRWKDAEPLEVVMETMKQVLGDDDAETGEILGSSLEGHGSEVTSILFSPHGKAS
jgi:predicted aconitase with swiveling domain